MAIDTHPETMDADLLVATALANGEPRVEGLDLAVVHALGPPSLSAQQSTGVVLGHVLQVLDVVAGPRVLAGPVEPPPRLAVLLVAGYPVMPGDMPTLGVNLPVQQPRPTAWRVASDP